MTTKSARNGQTQSSAGKVKEKVMAEDVAQG
jgi:hypothetical protein